MARVPSALVGIAFLAFHVPARPQVPPQAAQVLKKVGTAVVEKLLKPKMQVAFFTLGGIKATSVDCEGDATAEKFSGTATFALPAPLGERKLHFKNLVLKGTTAEGTLDEPLKDFSGDLHGWTCHFTRIVLSDKGSRVEGTATLAGLKLDVRPLALTATGLTGTLTPGDLPLVEGPFEATLLAGEVTFGPSNVQLKGNLEVLVDLPVRHALTGQAIRLEASSVAFDSALLTGTGPLGPNLASGLPFLHKGHTWVFQTLALRFERGMPRLGGPARLQFPLQVFCRVGATDQPYLSDPLTCSMAGKVPAPAPPRPSGVRPDRQVKAADLARAEVAWEGISGSLALPAALLHPSGLTAYRLTLEKGVVRVEKGELVSEGTKVTGTLAWGSNFSLVTSFAEAAADLAEGLYVRGKALPKSADVGAYQVNASFYGTVCDFSTGHSPEGLPEAWMGVHLPIYYLSLPEEISSLSQQNERLRVLVTGKAGRFEGNGTFSGVVAAKIGKEILLYVAPTFLDPFELRFVEGALLNGPEVTGKLNLEAPPILKKFTPPIKFKLTQNGVESAEIITQTPQGPMTGESYLTGITTVVESARLFPTLLDLTGRFDFAITGADIPSVNFDHLVLEAQGAGIEGSKEDLSFELVGSRWSNLADRPQVSLWGFPYALGENGYGIIKGETEKQDRFYVGLGGEVEMNPLMPITYNRLLFTTVPGNSEVGTVELEKPFEVSQSLASLGALDAHMGFRVETENNKVKDAYFMGDGALKLNLGSSSFALDAGMRFGRHFKDASSFPYFYALGIFEPPPAATIKVAPDFEVYGLVGGLAQNFLPETIRDTKDIEGKTDDNLGLAVMAGISAGTTDQFAFHGDLDLYVSQNLTTLIQGDGWLFSDRKQKPAENHVSADIRFTRNPDVFDATLTANLSLAQGLLKPMGQVQLHFGPDKQFLHIGTREAPIQVRVMDSFDGAGYMTADFEGGTRTFGAGASLGWSKEADFGIVWGNAWLNARGDLIIELDSELNPSFLGAFAAEGGGAFGMRFKTFWKTYKITIFSGSIGANMAFQAPGHPMLSGAVTIHYRVLGGLFSGSVSANLDL